MWEQSSGSAEKYKSGSNNYRLNIPEFGEKGFRAAKPRNHPLFSSRTGGIQQPNGGYIQQPNSNSNIQQEININLNKAEAGDGVKRLGYGYATADLRSEAQKGDSPSGKPI